MFAVGYKFRYLYRFAELENIAEDASEAVRRGGMLLHSQNVRCVLSIACALEDNIPYVNFQ